MHAQARRLMAMIDAAIKLLNTPDALLPVLVALGTRHSAYGTQEAHYPVVGSALISTLRKGLGDKFTAKVEKAWVNIYGVITENMIKGQQSERGQQLVAQYAARQAKKAKKAAEKAAKEAAAA